MVCCMHFRSRFPLFQHHPDLVYLDSASTAQRVDVALEAMERYHLTMNANVHRGLYPLAEGADAAYESVREKVMNFIGAASTQEIIFTRGTTEGLNIVAQGWGRQFLNDGDEIVLTELEHHSNLVPWQLIAERAGAILKFIPMIENGVLDPFAFDKMITRKTKIVSVTGLSNTLGTVVDLARIVERAHAVRALICVDAAQRVAHFPINVVDLDVDFLAFSSHKIYGPTGVGVLYAKRKHLEVMDPWLGGGNMIREVDFEVSTWNDLPWKFEAGTPPIAQVIGMGAAIDFIQEFGFDAIQQHDIELYHYAVERLSNLRYLKLLGPLNPEVHCAVLSFLVHGVHPHDVASILGRHNICVRAGHHCTMPLMKRLGVPATTRISFGLYTTKSDIDRLVDGLEIVAKMFKI